MACSGAPAVPSSPWPWRAGWQRASGLGFIAVFFALVCAPSVRQIWPGKPDAGSIENRRLAAVPAAPRSWPALGPFFADTDAWLNDHFGLRQNLIAWNNRLRFALFREVTAPQLTLGANGFIYFNSHDAAYPLSMIRYLCGVGISDAWRRQTTARLVALLRTAAGQHPASTLLIVPTKSVLYPEYLPQWLQAQCVRGVPPVPAMVDRLDEETGIRLAYPYEEMKSWKASVEVYPKTNFHWHGEGARRVADYLAQTRLGVDRLVDLPRTEVTAQSDLQKFIPGVDLDIRVEEPDYAAAGITRCAGPACFPEFPAAAAKLGDVSRYRAVDQTGPRLLIVSDSFGAYVAGNFSAYFSEVWHLSVNEITQLSRDEALAVRDAAFHRFHPDQVLYVFHDFSVLTALVNVQGLLEPLPASTRSDR